MKIALTLLVRNEEDVVETTIDYHLAQGVDLVIVTDNGSEDRTPEILARYERAGRAHVIHEPADDYAQGQWVTRMARLAAAEHGADWVINGDADEFWWPEHGSLRETLAAIPDRYAIVRAERVDFPPLAGVERNRVDALDVREVRSFNALGGPLPAKVCHRARPDVVVAQGNHDVEASEPLDASPARPIVIFHFPLRSYAQLERKIALGGAAYARNRELGPDVGATWRHLYGLLREGRLRDYYDARALDEQAIADGIASGRLVVDPRLRSFLRERLPAAGGRAR